MTIYANEIKLMQSQRMVDTDDGGGRMTGIEIVSGEHNTIFPDVSDLDRAYGVVNIMSVHAAVQSPNAETYYGATIGLLEPPQDENVNITLMSINDPYAVRSESQELIEQYMAKSAKWQGELYSSHLAGQRSIRIIQKNSIRLPVVGEVIVLYVKSSGEEQYVKITSVESQVTEFSSATVASYSRTVVTCVISEALRYAFTGVDANPYDSYGTTYSAIYETQVADAAKYYSVKPLRDNAAFGESKVTVPSVYAALVPSARISTSHVAKSMIDGEDFTVKSSANGAYSVSYPSLFNSEAFVVTAENQSYVYTKILSPAPAFGNTIISYMVNGDWYELRDNSNGEFSGSDSSYGTGIIDQYGNLSLTLGALPDITSSIIYQWADISVNTKLATVISSEAAFSIELSTAPDADSLVITWGTKTATVVNNIITGDATGSVRGNTVSLVTNTLPAPNTAFTFTWDRAYQYTTATKSETALSNQCIFTLAATGSGDEVVPGTVAIGFFVTPENYNDDEGRNNYTTETDYATVTDDKNGNLKSNGAIVGTINYITRECVMATSLYHTFTVQKWESWGSNTSNKRYWKDGTYTSSVLCTAEINENPSISLTLRYALSDGTDTSDDSEVLNLGEITVTVETEGLTLVSGSLVFTLAGRTYTQDGYKIYYGSTEVGTVDATTGICTITDWAAGSKTVQLLAGLLQNPLPSLTQSAVFITAGTPVASQSLQISAYTYSGTHIVATSSASGEITGPNFTGTIDYDTGVVSIYSTALLDATTLTYNCVSYNYLPLDADILGLDPIRLPSDGRVIIYRVGDIVVIHQDEQITKVVSAGETVNVGEVRLVKLEATGSPYSADLDAGTITFTNAATVVIDYRFEDMIQVIGVDISGQLTLSRALSHSYDGGKAYVASVLIAGNLWAHYNYLFDQQSWTSVWSNSLIGSEVSAQYNDTDYPLTLTNDGTITERWVIKFTTSTAFTLTGENVGQIAVGDINNDFAPNNPNTGKPYFTLNKLGWGAGWSSGNCLRLNTLGAVYQTNVIRTVLQSDSSSAPETDTFALQIRGNINKEV